MAGVIETISNPYILIRPFIRREAVLSSRIEGTNASLSEVFAHEAGVHNTRRGDVEEVRNYVDALEYGIGMLDSIPISFGLVNDLHVRLMAGVRGENKRPGEFRSVQVWIGEPGSSIQEARFIPPPPSLLRDLFFDWEKFVNQSQYMPPLARCALMHYQLEAIHPYSDGNGRIGRLLITLFLKATGVLSTPLLYLSAYFERDRQRYYDELLTLSATGGWEQWLTYFLEGVYHESRDALARIRRVRQLQDEWRDLLHNRRESANCLRLLEEIFARPALTVSGASDFLGISDPGTRRILGRLTDAGILTRIHSSWPNLYIAERLVYEIDRPI